MTNASLIVLLGPGIWEMRRFNDMIASLVHFEREWVARSTLLIVNDRNTYLTPGRVSELTQFREVIAIDNPYLGYQGGDLVYDRMSSGMLAALRVLVKRDNGQFILKLDTDAVACGKFSDRISQYFRVHPHTGIIGSLHHEPDGVVRRTEIWWGNWIKGTCGLLPRHWFRMYWRKPNTMRRLADITRWWRRNWLFRKALRSNWLCGASVLGGAYALSPEIIAALRIHSQVLEDVFIFDGTRISEDVAVSMLVAALGFTLGEYNRKGEVFGVWYQKPTLSLTQIFEMDFGIIHSIKSDDHEQEYTIREDLANRAGIPKELRERMGGFTNISDNAISENNLGS